MDEFHLTNAHWIVNGVCVPKQICRCETDSMRPMRKVRDRMLSKPLTKIHTHSRTLHQGYFSTHSHIIWKWDGVAVAATAIAAAAVNVVAWDEREMNAWSVAPEFKQIWSQYGAFTSCGCLHTDATVAFIKPFMNAWMIYNLTFWNMCNKLSARHRQTFNQAVHDEYIVSPALLDWWSVRCACVRVCLHDMHVCTVYETIALEPIVGKTFQSPTVRMLTVGCCYFEKCDACCWYLLSVLWTLRLG